MRHAPRRPEVLSVRPAEFRALVALAWPLALTNAIEMAMNLTSLALIGRIGAEALAASTLALALYNVALLFGIGVTAAVAPLVARETGRGPDTDAAVGRIVQQGFWGAALIAAPAWVVLWNGAPILVALGQDAELAASAATLPARPAMVDFAGARLSRAALAVRGARAASVGGRDRRAAVASTRC